MLVQIRFLVVVFLDRKRGGVHVRTLVWVLQSFYGVSYLLSPTETPHTHFQLVWNVKQNKCKIFYYIDAERRH